METFLLWLIWFPPITSFDLYLKICSVGPEPLEGCFGEVKSDTEFGQLVHINLLWVGGKGEGGHAQVDLEGV